MCIFCLGAFCTCVNWLQWPLYIINCLVFKNAKLNKLRHRYYIHITFTEYSYTNIYKAILIITCDSSAHKIVSTLQLVRVYVLPKIGWRVILQKKEIKIMYYLPEWICARTSFKQACFPMDTSASCSYELFEKYFFFLEDLKVHFM